MGEAKTSESFSEQTGSNHFNSEMRIGAEWTYLHLGHMLKTVTPPTHTPFIEMGLLCSLGWPPAQNFPVSAV